MTPIVPTEPRHTRAAAEAELWMLRIQVMECLASPSDRRRGDGTYARKAQPPDLEAVGAVRCEISGISRVQAVVGHTNRPSMSRVSWRGVRKNVQDARAQPPYAARMATLAPRPEPSGFTYDLRGALDGARRSAPLAAGVFAYGIPFGVLARTAGLSPLECLLLSALVFAGSAQFVALSLWATPLPVLAVVLATLVVNLRYVLMGLAAAPWLAGAPRITKYAGLFLLTDEVWALTAADVAAGGRNAALLPGGGLLLYTAWVGSTMLGRSAGSLIVDPRALGLDFVLTGTLIALLAGIWQGRSAIAPWAAAGGVAIAASRLLPGTWYILLGCLAGSLLAAVRHDG